MPIQTLQVLERKIERQIRLFELRNRALGRKLERKIATQRERIGQKFDAHKLRIEQTFDAQKKKFETHIRRFEQKNGIRIDDEFRFFRTWIEKPLSMGAVTPSGKALARTMAEYVDPHSDGPIIELGPGTGPEPAAAVVSGLPLFTKPLKMRLRLLQEAFGLMAGGAPFVQFTYAAYSPIPRRLDRVKSEASERIWTNIPPARVWVYRKD